MREVKTERLKAEEKSGARVTSVEGDEEVNEDELDSDDERRLGDFDDFFEIEVEAEADAGAGAELVFDLVGVGDFSSSSFSSISTSSPSFDKSIGWFVIFCFFGCEFDVADSSDFL